MTVGVGVALREGERILWQGAPAGGLRFRLADILFVPFAAVWTLFVLVAFRAAWNASQGFDLFTIIPLLMLCAGLYLLVGRFVWDALIRRGTSYTVTDRRVVIAERFPSSAIQEIPLHEALRVDLSGRNAVHLGERASLFPFANPFALWHEPRTSRLRAIADAAEVAEVIRAARDGSERAV